MTGTQVPLPHESAELHVTGQAVFTDDIPVDGRILIGHAVTSPHARARIVSFDLSRAKMVRGVHAVLCARDIPGANQMGPVVKDEPCLAEGEVNFVGQAVFLVAAETEEACREAEGSIDVRYEVLPAVLDLESAIRQGILLGPPRRIESGDVELALVNAPHRIGGELATGAQDHMYLETQVCLCLPGEGREMQVYSSTQHPSETQALVAGVLGIGRNDVRVEVRRLGGGFGGKETQANHTACWTALLSSATLRPVKIRLSRDEDMSMTGKRHRYLIRYEAGFDGEGVLSGVRFEFNSDGGASTDLSFAIMERTMLHADNAYYVPNVSVTGLIWKTNLPPNTAMRGFGAPQAMAAMESVIDRIARSLRRDPAEIRRKNFYGSGSRDVTHYGETIEHNRLPAIYEQLMASSDYAGRRAAVQEFNAGNEFYKKGIALTPVKFGISFTTTFLNQAGALVSIYQDGTVLVNHGGVEMGQGLNTKIRQIAAAELGVSVERVKVNATDTAKVPNTSATAASSGTDLNGMAVKNAIDTLKARLAGTMAGVFSAQEGGAEDPTRAEDIRFQGDWITDSAHPERKMPFAGAMPIVNLRQVSLSATGFYKTPGIGWDKVEGRGKPFHYYSFGMAVTEVLLDVLTGAHTILRTDILHDVGDSLNEGIDLGQLQGGYIQGVGWCTMEQILWDGQGRLMTHSPDTYKIPAVRDIPRDFRTALLTGVPNPDTIRSSKAVAEPPFMLSLSAWLAIKDAVSACADHQWEPVFSLPATNEVILMSIEDLNQKKALAEPHQVPSVQESRWST
jgi:xanthine dehydrogenase large subunit